MRGVIPLAAIGICLVLTVTLSLAPAKQRQDAARGKKAPQAAKAKGQARSPAAEPGQLDPLGPNAACYVCHMTFVDELLAKTHLQAEITCIDCHGTSEGHANDENIGATRPDIVIKRPQINRSCRKCHEEHDVEPERVVTRWIQRTKAAAAADLVPPNGHPRIVCTDCHGHHRVSKARRRGPRRKDAMDSSQDSGKKADH